VSLVEAERRTPTVPPLANLRRFLETEAGGAVVLLAATLVALIWANSPWRDGYHAVWSTELSLGLGDLAISDDLGHWVNDGLMALFFLLIGLEIRREFDMGELREHRRVAVPVIAALGGMVLPALIFLAFNPSGEQARGWAMVMATDTAFALGVLALAGRRTPLRLRIFLLTLVIVDDVGAISVIAVAYSAEVAPAALLVAAALLAVMYLLHRAGIQRPPLFWLLAISIWFATREAGIHPTVAGVAMGLLKGAYPPRRETLQEATGLTRAFREQPSPALAIAAARRITFSLSPNERLQHALHPWTSYVIVPLFALANAGIDVSPGALSAAFASSITWGVVVGLVVGKTHGILAGTWLATRRWTGGLALPVGWPSLVPVATVAGIGFTVSLLIANLAYTGPMLEQAKVGILTASVVAATLGTLLFQVLAWLPERWLRRAERATAPPLADLVVPVDPGRDHVRGAPAAPVTLVQYGDYECPYCREASGPIAELLRIFDGQLRFVARHLPLPDVHPNAALAAEAAEAAGAQGRFWEMHDLLYERQDAIQLPDLVRYAGELGLDSAQFEHKLRSGKFSDRVARDVDSAELAGVAGTPTFFINEQRYAGSYDVASLETAVRRALRTVEDWSSPAVPEARPPQA
jgi:Na+/H+ antiporter NhaA